MKTTGAEGERLIDIIEEGVGDLDSIFCPLSGDEMDGMAEGESSFEWPSVDF